MAYINTNHPDFIGGSAAVGMLERKHAKRRMDSERLRRQQQIASGIQFASSGVVGGSQVNGQGRRDDQSSVSAAPPIPMTKLPTQ